MTFFMAYPRCIGAVLGICQLVALSRSCRGRLRLLPHFKSYEAMKPIRLSTDVIQGKRNQAKIGAESAERIDSPPQRSSRVCRENSSVRNGVWYAIVIKM